MEDAITSNHSTRQERLLSLSQTAPNTTMGKLLRQFWQPVALSRTLKPKSATALRIMSEDLTLYRGESGKCYLVGGHCLHRLTLLHTGWVEGEEIRCMYHGWKYNGGGRCVERPAETSPLSDKVRIASYPTHEYAGLIFAYMGAGEAPEFDLPRSDAFERPNDLGFTRLEVWPCNWFQHVENSLDPAHVSFAHMVGRVGEFGRAITGTVPELDYEETDAGIKQTATRSKDNVRVSNWTFPNCNHVRVPGLTDDDPWIDTANWMVPIDDTKTARFSLRRIPSSTPEADERITKYFDEVESYCATDDHDALFNRKEYPEDPLVRLTSAQDYVALVGQGVIANRSRELLGKSDKGVVFLRNLFFREMTALSEQTPTKNWRRLAKAPDLPQPKRSV
ncbi:MULTISPECIES: Rieske 2Fe-2S domain-containing protein [unclassified Beijerinckia]|uniref:Rieske 2Fe-2S domain-containing protein n=1 Tax=unclassified Beijerinckia TaxID=2638183 RepID=UPI00089C37E4|nr:MULTISPECIES: Rieske 2Fe-2S domain-containing protein [unclassified Beijerinckia]MDH7797065.1 5,5'-dehydrodivanillate O-demethylase [Beijerinckia sp. GAS462]SEC70850.1 5,5'-dehydrodivanillate O-demethylase [Beijerinckia sp. 28-YEA-48]